MKERAQKRQRGETKRERMRDEEGFFLEGIPPVVYDNIKVLHYINWKANVWPSSVLKDTSFSQLKLPRDVCKIPL